MAIATACLLSGCMDGTDPLPPTIPANQWKPGPQETTHGTLDFGSIYPAIAGDWLGSGTVGASQAITEPVALDAPMADAPGVVRLPERIPARTGVDRPFDQAGVRAVLSASGWPEALWDAAGRVVECESRGNPGALGDSGRSAGLFQLAWLWFGYAGESADDWADPVVNARTAYAVYLYDIARGQPAWKQWSCKPY